MHQMQCLSLPYSKAEVGYVKSLYGCHQCEDVSIRDGQLLAWEAEVLLADVVLTKIMLT